MTNRKTANDVSADLRAHEAKCEERWKTIFAETAEIKQEMNELNAYDQDWLCLVSLDLWQRF
jgi:hypothetical protein